MKREIEYQIDVDNFLLSEKISGDFDISELVNYKDQLYKYTKLEDIEHFITDIRDMELEFNETEFVKSIESISKKHSFQNRKKHAIIIDYSKQVKWTSYLMLSLLSLGVDLKAKVFYDERTAKNWLLE